MKKIILIIALLIPLVFSCKKEPEPVPVVPTMAEKARDDLYDLMKIVYLWYDKIPTIKVSDYEGPADILEAMRYVPKDKWSFVANYDDFMNMMGGSFVGHGISLALDPGNQVRIVSIYHNCDLWPKGVRRGWIIKEVNDTPLAPIFIAGDNTAYNNLMGPSTAGLTNKFLFIKPDGSEVTYTSTKASFTINSVTTSTVLDLPGGKTGYLCFETFIEPSEQELNDAFAYFKANNITDLIIDLRYNRGGYLNIAQQLASLVMGAADTTKICVKLKFNNQVAADWNESYNFIRTASPLGLNRVVFITTGSTASASEVVINSLKAYITVKLVGSTTEGKPTGMNLWGYPFPTSSDQNPDYQYVFAPVTFEYVNALDQGGFYDGMTPDVLAGDDITHDFGDPEELSLKAAIAVLEGKKAASALPVRSSTIYTEGNQLPANLFLSPVK
jgi:carboxyl-terminal processing protease